MVEIRQRKGPSGPFNEDEGGGGAIYVNQVNFEDITFTDAESQITKESSRVYIWPFPEVDILAPPTGDQYPTSGGYEVFGNPRRTEDNVPNAWMAAGGCHSHIRIEQYNVLSDPLNLVPADPLTVDNPPDGTNGIYIRLGMGLLKTVPPLGQIDLSELIFDLVFILQSTSLHSDTIQGI